MKNRIKIFSLILILLFILSILLPVKSYCTMSQLITGMQDASNISSQGSNKITDGLNTILSLVRFVGSGISIIVVLMLGIKYMISSIEDKVEIKKRAIPIVVGCIILFATTNIVVIIADIVASI